jgi:hypothetical protein
MKICTLVLCLSLTGCPSDLSLAPSYASALVYFKDPRTGICFAGRNLSSNTAVVTTVPCSDAVERTIAEQGQSSP